MRRSCDRGDGRKGQSAAILVEVKWYSTQSLQVFGIFVDVSFSKDKVPEQKKQQMLPKAASHSKT